MPLRMTVEKVTPAKAAKYVEKNPNYRKLRARRVKMYANYLKKDEWPLTGQPIIFNGDGTLLDGQHRLYACIQTGIPFETVVIRGVESEAALMIDNIMPRTAIDAVTASGMKNSAAITTLSKYVLIWQQGLFYNRALMSTEIIWPEIVDFATANEIQLQEAHRLAMQIRKETKARPGLAGAFCYLAGKKSKSARNLFADEVITGIGLKETDPTLVLRRWLMNRALNKTKTTLEEEASAFAIAWNAFRQDKTMKLLRVPNFVGNAGEGRPEVPKLV